MQKLIFFRKSLDILITHCIIVYIKTKENIMKNEKITEKAKRPSKKVLLKEISDLSGKRIAELDSLGRSNIETIVWIRDMVKGA